MLCLFVIDGADRIPSRKIGRSMLDSSQASMGPFEIGGACSGCPSCSVISVASSPTKRTASCVKHPIWDGPWVSCLVERCFGGEFSGS